MKIEKIIILLLLFSLTSCVILKYQKIQKFVIKNYAKPNFIDKVDKQLIHPKSTDTQVIYFIEEMAKYHQKNINRYLRIELFPRYAGKKEIQKAIILALIKQENTDNIPFFMNLIKDKSEYLEFAKKTIIGFDKKYFLLWKEYLYNSDNNFRLEMLDIMQRMKNKLIDLLLDEYLFQKDEMNKTNLEYYFDNFKPLTAEYITEFILKGKIRNYDGINSLVKLVGHKYLFYYIPLFKSDSLYVNTINHKIFCTFGDSSIAKLPTIYPNIKELKNKKKIFAICDSIGSEISFMNLGYWLTYSEDVFEKESIIQVMTNITNTFPNSFIKLAEDPDNSYDVMKSLDKFLKTNPQSVLYAFYKSSEIAKVNFLKYFFENEEIEILEDVFSKIYDMSLDIRMFAILKILDSPYKSYYYDFILNILESRKIDEFIVAVRFCKLNKEVFANYIKNNFDTIATEDYKKRYLTTVFENTNNTDEFDFLIENYLKYFSENLSLANQFGNLFINNKYLNSTIIYKYFDKLSTANNIQAFINLLSLVKSKKLANLKALIDLAKTYYFKCNINDRLRILSFANKYSNTQIVKYVIDNYEEINLIEKKLLNTTLNKFSLDIIQSHLKKIVYLGDAEDFFVVEDLLNFRYETSDLPDDILEILAYYYYKINNFQKARNYIKFIKERSTFTNEILKIMEWCEKSIVFSETQRKKTLKNPINPVYVYKAIQDSLFEIKYILSYDSVNSKNKTIYDSKIEQYNNQLRILFNNYETYFEKIRQNNDYEIENNLLIKVLSSNYKYQLNCGNIVYIPQYGFRYLEIVLKIKNPSRNIIEINLSNFELSNHDNVYDIVWESEYYYKFIGKSINFDYEIAPDSYLILPIMFNVPADISNFTLLFKNNSIIGIRTPLNISPDIGIRKSE